jgi:putative phosphoesterase
MRVGIISDTHGLLRPQALHALKGVDHIIHGGDIGRPEIIETLQQIAPVTAIRGNVDTAEWASSYPDVAQITLAGRSVLVIHDLNDLRVDPAEQGIAIVVSGHSHRVRIETRNGILYLNPGSAGRRRFKLPITLATMDITPVGLHPTIHTLDD